MFVRKQVSEARNVSDKAKLFALVGLTEESARAQKAREAQRDALVLVDHPLGRQMHGRDRQVRGLDLPHLCRVEEHVRGTGSAKLVRAAGDGHEK